MVGCYSRQSIDKKDSLSIESQLQMMHNYCAAHSWEFKDYTDKGYSGKNMERPDFQKLLSEVRSGMINKIVCYKLDRISRNIAEFSNLIIELQKYGCDFVSITENFDTSSPIGRAMVMICMVFAQMERETISERVKDNYYYRTKLGFWGGGPAPYGYRLTRAQHDGKTYSALEIDEEHSHIVKHIYELYAAPGGSMRAILGWLYDNNISSPNGSYWNSIVISEMLERPSYAPNSMDVYLFMKSIGANIVNPPEEWDGTQSVDMFGIVGGNASKHKRLRDPKNMICCISRHKHIVDSTTWIMVNKKRIETKSSQAPRNGTGSRSPFTGLLKCATCGHSVSLSGRGKRNRVSYFSCSSYRNRGRSACSLPIFNQKRMEDFIWKNVIEHLSDPEIRSTVEAASSKNEENQNDIEKNNVMAEIENINNQIQNLIDALATGSEVTSNYINKRIEELDKKRSKLNEEIISSKAEADSKILHAEYIKSVLDNLDEIVHDGDFEERKKLAHTVIQKVTLHDDGGIEVVYWI